jgi:hypothetical protein
MVSYLLPACKGVMHLREKENPDVISSKNRRLKTGGGF